jgi:hypothetical protein
MVEEQEKWRGGGEGDGEYCEAEEVAKSKEIF